MDNIYALASGQGRAGVAVVRLSGDGVFTILKRLIKTSMPAPRLASLRSLYNPNTHDLLDKALVIIFQAPHSYSGENMVELHVHGGRAVLNALFSVLQKMPDIRLSEAGEFTRRAFLNNRLNLTEAEGVMDLINAESDAARRLALQQANGGLTDIYQKWMQSLKESAAFMEACIDFSDEELPENTWKEALITVKKLQCDIQQHLTMGHQAERVRSGVTAVILGPPNAGKSSLLNWFAGRDVAIVSTIAGTTRDSIEVFLEIDGLPFVLIDTAGLNPDSVDEIESIGITRAYQHGKKADMRLFLYDVATLSDRPDRPDLFNADTDICIFNKGDKLHERPAFIRDDDIYISVLNDDMDDLMRVVNEKIHYLTDFQEMPALTQARHRDHLQNANENLKAAMQSPLPELAAEELRHALHSLGCITGQVNIEEILDVVFSQFCIGK